MQAKGDQNQTALPMKYQNQIKASVEKDEWEK